MADRLQKVLVQLQEVALDALDAAHEDHKTPLLNERALARDGDARLADEGTWTIFSGDINDFKNLNAEVGYNNADIVLHAVGVALRDICRETGGSGYRRGGDEFVDIGRAGPWGHLDGR